MFGVAVHLNDRVVDIDQHPATGAVADDLRGSLALSCQACEEPRGERVELADVTERERAQERPQRRRRVRPGEDPAHPTVPQQRHVVDAVGASDHPRDQRGDLQPSVGALVTRHAQMLIRKAPQPRPISQGQGRNQPGGRHEIRVIEDR